MVVNKCILINRKSGSNLSQLLSGMNAAIFIVFINDFDTKSLFALKVCFQFFFRENPQAVLLQEVTSETLPILQQHCTGYQVIPGGTIDYFTAIMLKESHVQFKGKEIWPFDNTVMMRNLLCVKVLYLQSFQR